jgi:hypothetical protein
VAAATPRHTVVVSFPKLPTGHIPSSSEWIQHGVLCILDNTLDFAFLAPLGTGIKVERVRGLLFFCVFLKFTGNANTFCTLGQTWGRHMRGMFVTSHDTWGPNPLLFLLLLGSFCPFVTNIRPRTNSPRNARTASGRRREIEREENPFRFNHTLGVTSRRRWNGTGCIKDVEYTRDVWVF